MENSAKKIPRWEYCFAVVALLLSTGAFIPLVKKQNGFGIDPVQGDATMQILWLVIYAVTCLLLLPRLRRVQALVWQHRLLLCLVGLAFVSAVWSEAPLLTLRRSVALLGTTLLGIYLATRFSRQELMKILAATFGLITLSSIAFAVFLPWYGLQIRTEDYLWRGIYENKNFLGAMMSLAVMVWLINYRGSVRMRLAAVTFAGISAVVLILSDSVNALLVLLAVLAILLVCLAYFTFVHSHFKQRGRIFVLVVLVAVALAGWLVYMHWPWLLSLLGRNTTLSGRTMLWQTVWEMIEQRPWLGYGYTAFWQGWEGWSAVVWSRMHWGPPHAHNGYLDLWLELGLVGVAAFAASLVANLRGAFIRACGERNQLAIFPFLFFIFMALYNIAESAILARNSIYWVLYVVFTVQVGAGDNKHGSDAPD